ncbi:MAG: response regulator [Desulfobacteraceae bacterium]
MQKHHSCLNTRAIIEYFQEISPSQVPKLFEGLGPEIDALDNPQEFLMEINNWVSSDVVIKMFDNAKKITKDNEIAFKIGFESAARKKLGYVQRIVMFAYKNPRRTLKKVQAINDKFNKNKVIEIVETKRDRATIRLHWIKHLSSSRDFCLYNKGIYAGIPTMWNLPPAEVQETKCFFEGDEYCEYNFVWKKKSFFKELLLWMLVPWRLLTSTIEELERDKELLKKKFDEVHRLNVQLKEKIDHLMCLQETSTAVLSVLDLEELLQATLRLLLNFAKLDRAGIFLLDDNGRVLELQYGVGIEADLLNKLRGYKIPISKVDNIIARVAMNGIPIVIQDVEHSKLNKANILLQQFKPKVFMLAPLTVRGKVIGVILADRLDPKAVITETDKEFVVSFANQIAIALENAILYKKLSISERKYRELVENAHEGIWIIDENGKIKFVNRRMREITGYAELENRNISEVFAQENTKILIEALFQNLKGNSVRRELEFMVKDQGRVSVIMSSVPLVENDQFLGAFAMFTDISEKKKMQKQLLQKQKMEAIGTLAGGIAHNFNNILMNIMGLTGLAQSDIGGSHPVYAELKQIEQEVSKGADLTKQLLSYARGNQFEPKPTDLNALIGKTADLFCRTRKDICIAQNLAPQLPPVEVDQGQFEQVLLNLFVNGWQAMSNAGELVLSTREVYLGEDYCRINGQQPGRYVHIALSDFGEGMDAQTKARVFEPFFTTRDVGQGTGLGLATSYAIIKNHKGIIEVESEKGRGTTFHIYLPVTQKPIVTEEAVSHQYIKGSGTILLVDDEEMIRTVGTKILERLGYKILPAESGQRAISIYREGKDDIDLVILDMIMPGMGGRETYKLLKQINPGVKVLISSGYGLEEEGPGMIEDGNLDFIQKPYRIEALSQKIADMLNMN